MLAKLIRGNIETAMQQAAKSGRLTQIGEDLYPPMG